MLGSVCSLTGWGKATLKVLLGWCGCCVVSKGMVCVLFCAGEHCYQISPERECRNSEGAEVKLIAPFSKVFVALICIYSANKLLKPYVKQYLIHWKLFNSSWKSLTWFLRKRILPALYSLAPSPHIHQIQTVPKVLPVEPVWAESIFHEVQEKRVYVSIKTRWFQAKEKKTRRSQKRE